MVITSNDEINMLAYRNNHSKHESQGIKDEQP